MKSLNAGKYSGKFIVLDGGDGCGKSTQVRMLKDWLTDQGVRVAGFRDPGDTVIGEKIRHILLDTAHEGMSDNVEVLLYMAARAQLWTEKIQTALEEGKCVVMDRWVSSTCAYQGFAGRFGIENIIRLADDCLERTWPDVTIFLDVDIKTAEKRMDRQLDRMEQKSRTYHEKVREGFIKLTDLYDAVTKIDASEAIEDVFTKVLEAVEEHI